MRDQAMVALGHVNKADEWENRDNVDRELRARMVDYHLRLAQIHAMLSVAQKVSKR